MLSRKGQVEMAEHEYIFTVITPVYNAEAFLEETLDCVVKQTIGFKDNIQHILVNDGSTDGSGRICESYAERYPDNVLYIEKENGGVSSARNEALKHIIGKYTVFLDGDDIWDTNAFRLIRDFFDRYYETVDVCTCKLEYIGAFAEKEHPQDFKYDKGSRIIDLKAEPEYVSTPIGNAVFRSSALKGHSFDEDMKYCEDTCFMNRIIAEKAKIGVIAEAVFYYRKTTGEGNASLGILETPEWYFDVPRYYYQRLISFAEDKFGYVPRFIQEVLIYDIKWRGYRPEVIKTFTEEEKKVHLDLMREVLSYIDDEVILDATGVNQNKRLYMANLKHGKNLIEDSVLENDRFYYDGKQVLSLRGRSMIFIRGFDITDNCLNLEGILRAEAIRLPYRFEICDEDGKTYDIRYDDYPDGDLMGYVGEVISKGELFNTKIPLKAGRRLYFWLYLNGEKLALRPTFDDHIRIERGQIHNYAVNNGYVIKLRKNVLSFYADSKSERFKSELRLTRELMKKNEPGWSKTRSIERKLIRVVNDSRLSDRIAFISVRSDGQMKENLRCVYDLIDEPKAYYCSRSISTEPEIELEAAKLLYTSKVVVTDDYLPLFRNNKKREGQSYIQLWHAAGAFKMFGKHGSNMPPGMDRMYHRDYDLVAVSSDYVRDFYADAFQIDKDKVKALGLPRSDKFYDSAYLEAKKNEVLEKMPEAEGRQVIVYAPTFRGESTRRVYLPQLDYGRINAALNDDQLLVVCPHPLMQKYAGKWNYDKIRLVQDISTNDMMIAADLMVTDYSSVIFEYSLLNKPMAFFCFDYDDYDRDFYLDYDKDLPGDIFKSEDELIEFMKTGKFETDSRLDNFKEKYMSACDGNSSKRVAEAVKEIYHKK